MNKEQKGIKLDISRSQMNQKIHHIYYKEAILNHDNLQERAKFTEAYNMEVSNSITMKVIELKVQLRRNKIPQNNVIPTNTISTIKRDGTHKARIVCGDDKQDESSYSDIGTSILDMEFLKLLLILLTIITCT